MGIVADPPNPLLELRRAGSMSRSIFMLRRDADGEITKGAVEAGVRGELIVLVPPLTLVCGELAPVAEMAALREPFPTGYWENCWCWCRKVGEGYMNPSDMEGDSRGETLYGIPKVIRWSVWILGIPWSSLP